MASTAAPLPLNVAIVGAGIAGLCAGIALRRSNQANIITIYERSTFKNEIGAAITLTPNANRILDRWGFDSKAYNETDKQQTRLVDAQTLEVLHQSNFTNVKSDFGANYNAYHRVDLHRGLRTMAESLGVDIKLGREVVDLDCSEGIVKFKDGAESKHDLIVVADGIRSSLVKTVTGLDISPAKIGKSVFRGLVPMAALRSNPVIWSQFENQPSGFYTCRHEGTMVMTYPCAGDQIMNVAVFHTTRPGHEDDEGWSSPATKAEVLSVLQDMHPIWSAIVEAAESDDDFKCFPIKFRDTIPRYNNGRAILIGDAAHPFQPTHAQGGCCSIEDAASLSTLFRNTDNIPQRCQLYSDFRIPRANTTQLYSNVMFYQTSGEKNERDYEAKIREFYPEGPLMPMNIRSWTLPTQEFWFPYDVDREAEKAIQWFEKNNNGGREGERLPPGIVRHFY